MGAAIAGAAVALGAFGLAFAANAPPLGPIEAYHDSRVLIPMRDGAQLEAFVLSPPDTSHNYPILLDRTPYDPAHSRRAAGVVMAKAGYIFVTQSVRGRYGSQGTFVHMRPQKDVRRDKNDIDESTDTFDTIDWLVKHIPNNNGRVGLRGISYDGFYAAVGMIDAHPALKAVSPQAPQADWFLGDDTHHNGAFLLASTFAYMPACDRISTGSKRCGKPIDPGTPDGYRFYLDLGPLRNAETRYLHGDVPEWTQTMAHGTYDDLWRSRNLLPHLTNIRPAVLAVSGWYDANNLYGTLHVFDSVRRTSSTPATLVLGPWTHGQWAGNSGESAGALHFGSATSDYFVQEVELPFFEAYLKGDGRPNLPLARVFDTGTMAWASFDAWPPKTATQQSLYLAPNRVLQVGTPPKATSPVYDEYVSDPQHPVPFVAQGGFDMDEDYMAQDQRFASDRPDVLTYETAPLSEAVTIIGPVSPHLVVSTSGTDSDWVVKLIDVHPAEQGQPAGQGGLQQLVRGDVMRGKFRDSFSTPTAMQPNEPTHIDFTMTDVYHTFKKGHRIRVQVQSSWFPLIDRNPQRFVDIYAARETDFQQATQRVFHSGQQLSRLEINVLPSVH
jgi:putative CocE/NonD family hydrolase